MFGSVIVNLDDDSTFSIQMHEPLYTLGAVGQSTILKAPGKISDKM